MSLYDVKWRHCKFSPILVPQQTKVAKQTSSVWMGFKKKYCVEEQTILLVKCALLMGDAPTRIHQETLLSSLYQ